MQFATTIHSNITETDTGLELRFDRPDASALVRHGGSIQCSASTIDRLVGRVNLTPDRQLNEATVSLTLVDRTNQRVRLAGQASDTTAINVGRAMMIAIEFEGWVEHADPHDAYRHSGAMAGRIVLTGRCDQAGWSLNFVGDYKAAATRSDRMSPRVQMHCPTHAA